MKGAKPTLKTIEGGLLKAPPPPDGLPKEAVQEWVEITSDMIGRKLLTTSMMGVVETYVTALWTVRQCRKEIAQDGPVVRAKDGQPKPHPANNLMVKANDTVARLSVELGLTPSARSRKGMNSGSDSSGDELEEMGI
jgi:P27 family predicted phage terminase small subunit